MLTGLHILPLVPFLPSRCIPASEGPSSFSGQVSIITHSLVSVLIPFSRLHCFIMLIIVSSLLQQTSSE